MKKFLKWFLSLAVIGTVIGLIIAYFFKDESDDFCEDDDFVDDEEEDFDLDSDLQPVSDREYVSLKKTNTTEEEASDENFDEDPSVNETEE